VDNAPLRGCVAHRRSLRPHAHSLQLNIEKENQTTTTGRVTFLREATRAFKVVDPGQTIVNPFDGKAEWWQNFTREA